MQPEADELGGICIVALGGGLQEALEHLLQLAYLWQRKRGEGP